MPNNVRDGRLTDDVKTATIFNMAPDMHEDQSQHSPLYENPALINESRGSEEYLDLLVGREMLWDEGVRMRKETGEIPPEHMDKVHAINQKIKEVRQGLGHEPYE